MRVVTVAILALLLLRAGSSTTLAEGGAKDAYNKDAKWAASATFTDSCCCDPSCPCLFGSAASLGHCDGVTLIEFHRAHYGKVNLDGVIVVAVYRSKRTMNYYVSDKATKPQTEAVVKLIPQYIPFYDLKKVSAVKNVPITVQRDAERIKVTTPHTNVEIVVMKGKGGAPIKLQNMPAEDFPAPAFLDHTQYKSVSLVHKGKDEEFDYEGTNGFVARLATLSSAE